MKNTLTICLLYLSVISYSQSVISDSRNEKLRSATGQEKIDLLIEIINETQRSKPWEAKRFANLLLKESRATKSRYEEANALNYLASIEGQQGDYLKAISYSSKAINLFKSLKKRREECKTLLQLGKYYRYLEDHTAGIGVLKQVETLAKTMGYKDLLGNAYRYLGNIYYDRGDYKLSKNYQMKSMALEELAGNEEGIAYTSHNLGLLFMREENYDSAQHYMVVSLEYDKEKNNLRGIGVSYISLIRLHLYKGDLVKAEEYANLAIQIADSINSSDTKAIVYSMLPIIYSSKGDTYNSLRYTEKFQRFKDQLFEDRMESRLTAVRLDHQAEKKVLETELTDQYSKELDRISGVKSKYLIAIVTLSFFLVIALIKLLTRGSRDHEELDSVISE